MLDNQPKKETLNQLYKSYDKAHLTKLKPNELLVQLKNASFNTDIDEIVLLTLKYNIETFFEKEEENISSFLTSLFDSTKDESNDPEEIQQPKQSPKQTPLVLFPLTQPITNTCTNQSSLITTKPTIIHKPVPVRRNRGLYCRSFK